MLLWTVPYRVQSFAVMKTEGNPIMRSYKIFTLLLTAALFAGCEDNVKKRDSEMIGSNMPGITSVTGVAEPTTKRDASQYNTVKFKHEILDDCIVFYLDSVEKGRINIDKKVYETELITEDYNFDGYQDVFIKDRGYWLYDPDNECFAESDQFPYRRGRLLNVEVKNVREKTLKSEFSSSGTEVTVYKWKEGKLVPQSFEYDSPIEGIRYSCIFDENNNKIMTKRVTYDKETGKTVSTDDHPEYFRFTDHSIDHMKGSDIVQIIDVSFTPEEIRMDERYIFDDKDYNFDGHNDLRCEIREKDKDIKYLYFFFEPGSGMYVKNNVLTDLNKNVSIRTNEEEEKILCYETGGDQDKNTYYCEWQNGALQPYKRTNYYEFVREDGSTGWVTDIYYYDDERNEVLVDTIEAQPSSQVAVS